MKQVVVGCDLDDVLADFITPYLNIAQRLYGIDPSIRPTSWEWTNIGITQTQMDGIWAVIHATEDFWVDVPLLPNIDKALLRMLDDKTDLYFPTARDTSKGDSVARQSSIWLRRHFRLDFPRVIVSSEKGKMAKALEYDFFIDDRGKNCLEVARALPDCRVFLCNATHNQDFEDSPAYKDFHLNHEYGRSILRTPGFGSFAWNVLMEVKRREGA